MFKKGDICIMVKTTLTHYGFGSGREPTRHMTFRLVRCEAAAVKGTRVVKYRAYPTSPLYRAGPTYSGARFATISGENQARAKRLFDAATYFVEWDSQEAAKAAILAA